MEQHDWFDGGRPQNLVKASAKLCMTIMQQTTATLEHPVPGHCQVSRHLMKCEPGRRVLRTDPLLVETSKKSGEKVPVNVPVNESWLSSCGVLDGLLVCNNRA
jgi:hypothetical protein